MMFNLILFDKSLFLFFIATLITSLSEKNLTLFL